MKNQQRRPVYRTSKAEGVNCTLTVERLAWGGLGLARVEDGRLVLLKAPLALLPGEVVEAEVHWKPRHGEGKVLGWVKPSPHRRDPGCPAAETCGGCDLRGAGAQLGALKRSLVEDLFHRQLPGQAWTWLEAPDTALRHRIQLHWNGTTLGFHARGSHKVIPVKHCPSAAPCLSDAIPRLREALEAKVLPPMPSRWELATGTPAGDVWAMDGKDRVWRLEPHGWERVREEGGIHHRHRGLDLRHAAGGFFQVCPPWAMDAFGQVLEGWDLRGATLYDLYGGVGLFSALLGDRFQHRVLVEGFEPAVEWARRNLTAAGLSHEAHAEDVGTWLPEALGQEGDLVLLDPPRTGLDPVVAARLQGSGASALVLVGCDGAAFCRDLTRLAPRWKVAQVTVLDLFPHTSHVECVALLLPAGTTPA